MTPISWTILIALFLAFVITLPFSEHVMATQGQIITLPGSENNTRLILNMDNHTQTLVNATTNETISVENFTLYKGNITANETASTNNSLLNPENAPANETLITDMQNATTDVNLTAKFNGLQGK
jgi:hypothetical protein